MLKVLQAAQDVLDMESLVSDHNPIIPGVTIHESAYIDGHVRLVEELKFAFQSYSKGL